MSRESGEPQVVVEAQQAGDLAEDRLRSASRDVAARLPRLPGKEGELAERRHVGEVQVRQVQMHRVDVAELDAGEGGLKVFESGDVGLAPEDDPGGVLA